MKKISEILIIQDHFGITPFFTYKRRPKFHNLFCEIVSLIMNILCVFFFCIEISELLKKNKLL